MMNNRKIDDWSSNIWKSSAPSHITIVIMIVCFVFVFIAEERKWFLIRGVKVKMIFCLLLLIIILAVGVLGVACVVWSLAESTTFNFISFTLTIIITSLRHRCSSTYWHRIHLRADRCRSSWMALSWRSSCCLCVVLITWCTIESTVAVCWLTRCRRWWWW